MFPEFEIGSRQSLFNLVICESKMSFANVISVTLAQFLSHIDKFTFEIRFI